MGLDETSVKRKFVKLLFLLFLLTPRLLLIQAELERIVKGHAWVVKKISRNFLYEYGVFNLFEKQNSACFFVSKCVYVN